MSHLVYVEWSTHEDIKRGVVALGHSLVEVAAATYQDAQLLAAQIVASDGRIPTRTAPA